MRVMKPDGEFQQFEFPCVAAEVMVAHPGHLVVHCTPVDKNTIGQRTKITIMVPEQPLMPGQPYMLYPIPDHYKKSLARSKSFSKLKSKFESNSAPTAITPAEKRQGRRKALKMIFTRLNLATFVASTISGHSEGESSQSHQSPQSPQEAVQEEEIEEENGKKAMTVQLPNPADLNYAWRPILSTIPESPLGFHSQPQSPLGLYKMDGPVPASPLGVGSRRVPTYVAASS